MTYTQSHKDLIVWQKSIDLAVIIYELTECFPKEERYGLTSQMRRASVSIASNIAEGRYRVSNKDYTHFLRISLGSTAEIDTQLCIVKRFGWSQKIDFSDVEDLLPQITKMLKAMINGLVLKANRQSLKAAD